jgi:chromosome segregation ATPase
MARKATTTQTLEIRDLRDRLEWLDGERRRLSRNVTELEQRLALREREVEGREKRIQALEQQLTSVSAQVARTTQLDTQLAQFKDELVQLIEQYDQRRIRAEDELDRLRRVEHEVTAREIADVRKQLPAIGRLEEEMEMRTAEEARLARLIGEQKNQLGGLDDRIESSEQTITFLNEKEKQDSSNIAQAQTSILEINRRLEHLRERFENTSASIVRVESNQTDTTSEVTRVQESLKSWIEQIRVGEYERNQQLAAWERERAEHEETLQKYSQDWIAFSDQYKEAKMAVQSLSEWQKQQEQQQREATQILKVEFHRLQSIWDDFVLDHENKWKNFNIEAEQRRATIERNEKRLEEKITALEGMVSTLDQEKELIKRVQAAQTDAIKRLPLMWIEEVEKAIAQNPQRRRQPALVPVREE